MLYNQTFISINKVFSLLKYRIDFTKYLDIGSFELSSYSLVSFTCV